jgi:hypothetical protein
MKCPANGIFRESGMLLKMRSFVRENPDKRRTCITYRCRKAA